MNPKLMMIVVCGVASFVLLALFGWLAGAIGIVLSVPLILIMWIRFAIYLGIVVFPSKAKTALNWSAAIALISVIAVWGIGAVKNQIIEAEYETKKISTQARGAETAKVERTEPIQIYPNYEFSDGVDQIKVPLIPSHYVLPREAGGWVTTPHGSLYEVDYKTPVMIEYIDGRKFYREPSAPAWDDVRIDNRIFRVYGAEGKFAEIRIKRKVY